MVLRKNSNTGELESEYLPLQFKDQDKLNELLEMSKSADVSVLDLYDAAINKGLGYLFQNYNFCDSLEGIYQECYSIPRNDIVNGRYYKYGLVNQLKTRVIAHCLREKYKECKDDPSVVAYSTRLIGWSSMNYTLNDVLSISYNTNFGYGWSSYFTANLRYKDIDILPYSMWVHYYRCEISQILQYTRVYKIANSEWEKALIFGRDVCNSLINDPESFANKWLVGEVESMVNGLRSIFDNHSNYIAVNESNGSTRELRTREEIVLFKGEKMTGALSFIDKIKEIENLNISMDSYIESILDMNQQMIPELQEIINEYNKDIKYKKAERDLLLQEIAPIKEYVENHVSDCATNFIGGTRYYAECEAQKVLEMISPTFKESSKRLNELEEKDEVLSGIIYHLTSVVKTLTGYIETIEKAVKTVYGTVA